MAGIEREITPDPRISLFDRHLPDTNQVKRLLKKEGKAHVFHDRITMEMVIQSIIERGERTGIEDENDENMSVMDCTFLSR